MCLRIPNEFFLSKCFYLLSITLLFFAFYGCLFKSNESEDAVDEQPPVISLNGESSISLKVGDEYIDPGVKAMDNVEGDISVKVSIGGKSNSIQVATHSSLISSITRKPVNGEWPRRPLMDTMAILTVVEEIPVEGDFRPPYTGTNKSSQFNINNLDYTFLPAIEGVNENPDISTIEAYFERPWIDFTKRWTYHDLAPLNNMPSYGRLYAAQTGMAALSLALDFTNEEKETLLIRYVQLGLDLYGAMKNGMEWHPAGGFFHGRKLPILFAGNVLGNQTILDDLRSFESKIPFQEDGSIFRVTQEHVDITNSSSWHPNETAHERGDVETYSASDIGMPEWGVQHNVGESKVVFSIPTADNRYFNAGYRLINGSPNIATVMAVYILGLKEQWNNDLFFEYHDRYAAVFLPHDDSQFYYAIGQPFVFVKRMWEKYRVDYPPVFVSEPEWLTGYDLHGGQWFDHDNDGVFDYNDD